MNIEICFAFEEMVETYRSSWGNKYIYAWEKQRGIYFLHL